jgi:hypothetical protein
MNDKKLDTGTVFQDFFIQVIKECTFNVHFSKVFIYVCLSCGNPSADILVGMLK